ncbi:hypothetical protein SYNPS1DRAFT_29968 [Syncephalis pseudoplumigaleata]|uniref:ER membrane protein complex subunit 1 n=1 Tax=Syncephalis pseudoplumigaleata TaxID=1712513 RepID=A0A4P9YWM8_9FUNG|nr:hypothetical protein SYNPS1DRAFT_29968 [Syncephalis pseudoplumigaleata]|eukprot:RKP24265.1 hypothetical protein SYNPS1DRAFT_29968 [Syncephalis pseudoplumigaleata]
MRRLRVGLHYALCLLVCLLQLSRITTALYEDQAGLYDWHIPLIGVPRQSLFHRADTRSRQLLLLTDRGILASVQPRSGALVWRHDLSQGTGATTAGEHMLRAYKEYVATLSTTKNKLVLRVWHIKSSFLVWEHVQTSSKQMQAEMVMLPEGDIILVTACHELTRFSIKDGQIVWQHQLAIRDGRCYQSAAMTGDHNKLHVFDASEQSALRVVEVNVHAGEAGEATSTSIKPAAAAEKPLVWMQAMDSTTMYAVWLAQTDKQQWTLYAQSAADAQPVALLFEFGKQVSIEVRPLSENSRVLWISAHTLAANRRYYGYLVTLEAGQLVKAVKFFSQTPSVFGHVHTDSREHTLVGRLSADMNASEIDLCVYDLKDPVAIAYTSKVPFSLDNTGPLAEAIFEAAIDEQGKVEAVRTLVTTADESIHLLRDTKHVWTREESLSHVVAMEAIDLPEDNLMSLEHDELVSRADDGDEHASGASAVESGSNATLLRKDAFGLRRLLVFITRSGKLIAMDSANKGSAVWSRYDGVHAVAERAVKVHGMFNVRSTIVKYPPLLAVVVTKYSDETPVTSVLCVDALTGQNYTAAFEGTVYPGVEPQKIYHLPLASSHTEHVDMLAFMDERQQLHLWPSTVESREHLMRHASQWTFAQGWQQGSSQLRGYELAASQDEKQSSLATREAWQLMLPDDLHIVATARHPSYDPTASIGRTLGNRSVLFKYLNPNLIAVAAVHKHEARSERLYVYLLDSVSGTVLYHTVYAGVVVDALHPVHLVLSENWLVATFAGQGDAHLGTAKGYQAVVLELYESDMEDARVDGQVIKCAHYPAHSSNSYVPLISDVFSSFDPHRPYVMSQAYALPYGVNAAGVTITRLGITTKKLLGKLGLPSGQLYGIPRQLLDARRSMGAVSDVDQENGLLPYEPAIPFIPSHVLSYNQTVRVNIYAIITLARIADVRC